MQPEISLIHIVAASIPFWPFAALCALSTALMVWRAPSERATARVVILALDLSFVGALATATLLLASGEPSLDLSFGQWFAVAHYEFDVSMHIDALSVRMLLLSSFLTSLVARFSVTYLHAEAGFARFFLQLALFAAGTFVVVTAGTVDLLFMGWECVGLSSAMLVAFFHEREAPARASVWVFATYRFCDVGFLVAAALIHQATHSVAFVHLFGAGAWPQTTSALSGGTATAAALCLGLAAMGKSAQFPVGNWLARAMEGPTPSSALFYGGVSVHLGVYLLLRMAPVLAASPTASAVIVLVGALTTVYATLVWRVQTDFKSRIAYATMTQLGLMFAECGLGFYEFASWHLVLHACVRTYQLLRAPSALHDDHLLRATNHGHSFPTGAWLHRIVPLELQHRLYLLALERFHLDGLQRQWLVDGFRSAGSAADRIERRYVGRPGPLTAVIRPLEKLAVRSVAARNRIHD
ncbi:MAG: NADH-quinone oxidoreductase subunit L [Planctomycetota bacterium]|jgi:NADH-quinone oxidoreductase subunit L